MVSIINYTNIFIFQLFQIHFYLKVVAIYEKFKELEFFEFELWCTQIQLFITSIQGVQRSFALPIDLDIKIFRLNIFDKEDSNH